MFKSYKFHKLAMSGLLTKPVCICEHVNQCHTQPRIQGLISAPRPTPPCHTMLNAKQMAQN